MSYNKRHKHIGKTKLLWGWPSKELMGKLGVVFKLFALQHLSHSASAAPRMLCKKKVLRELTEGGHGVAQTPVK
jgi:hypothetical protein